MAPKWQSGARCAQTAAWCAASESCSALVSKPCLCQFTEARRRELRCSSGRLHGTATTRRQHSSPCPSPGRCRPQSSAASACRPGRWTGRCCGGLQVTGAMFSAAKYEAAFAGARSTPLIQAVQHQQLPAARSALPDVSPRLTLQVRLVHGQVEAHLDALPAAAQGF